MQIDLDGARDSAHPRLRQTVSRGDEAIAQIGIGAGGIKRRTRQIEEVDGDAIVIEIDPEQGTVWEGVGGGHEEACALGLT